MSAAHGVSFAPDVSPVHGSSGHGADGGGAENGDVAFNSAEKDRARARRARSLAKFHRVSVGMSARKSLGGSRSSIGGGGINGRPSLLLGVLAAGVEYSTHQYSVRRSNVKPAEGGASRNELGAPPAKPRFSLATGGMHSMHSNSSGCANAGGITMDSFRGVSIVGGQFLRRFEAGLPVVGLPAQLHAAQVVGADLTHTGLLKLTVHHPTTGARKTVQIFTTRNRCHTLRVFPTGLLVSAQAFAASSSSSSGGGGGSRSGGAGAKVAYFLKQELYQFTGLLDALAPTLANNVSDAASWTAAASLPLPPPLALELQLPPHPSQSALASNAPTTTTTPRAHRNAPLRSCRASQGAAAGSRDSNAADDDDDDGMMRDPGVTPGPSLGSHNTKDGGGGSAVKHSGVTPALDAMNIFSPISGGGKMDHDGNDADVFVNMALESSVCMDEISGLENDDDDEASAALSNSFRRGLRVATPTASGALLVAASGGAAATAAAPTAAASNKAKHDEELVDSDTDTAIDDDEDLAATQLTQECDAELMHYGASDLPVLLTAHILSFLTVADLLQGPLSAAWGFSGCSSGSAVAAGGCVAVCRAWSVAAAHAHASLVAAAAVADPSTSSAAATSRSNGASSNGPPVALNLRSGGRSTAASSEQQQQQPPPLVRQRSMLPPGAAKSATSKGGAVIVKSWAMLCDHMPWGAFLSEGAYKKVYRVVNAQAMPPAIMAAKHQWDSSALAACGGGGSAAVAGVEWVQEAVSVMNVKAIIENGAGSVVQQELKVSLLVSSLVRRGTCPNFVETFGVFGADFAPPPEVWGSEERKQPHGKSPSAYPQLPLKLANQLNARGTAAAVESSSSSSSSNSGAAGEKENAQAVREHHSAAVKSLQPWRGDAAKRVRASSSLPRGRHQYIRMELCTHGDLEVFLQKQPTLTLTNEALPPLAFQMVFSLYCAQQEFSLRHYDVKLLNFLLKEVPPTLTSQAPLLQSLHKKGSNGACSSLSSSSGVGALASQQEGEEEVAVSYGVPGQAFRFTLPAATGPTSHRLWVKLGDFGTADVNPATLGAPVGLEQFTTLENTPIEQLLLGAGATQAYAADTWALGLSLLHLFTGHAPYEELMVDVVCPDELRLALEAVWQDPALEAQYGVVADAAGEEEQASIDMDLSSSDILDGGGGGMDRTLADTLYRYVVLCGLPEAAVVDATPAWHQNPILRACLVHLRTGDLPGALQRPGSSSGRGRGSGAPTKAAAKKLASAFEKHRNLWSLAKGNAPPMAAARTKLDAMGGAVLLQDMLAFDPLQRPTMLEALQSDLFSDLRCADSEARAAHHAFLKYL
jgi:serine/threonine protein kinase